MYFDMKSYLKSTRNHTAKHALRTQGERERERLIASADKVPSFKIQHQPIKPFGTIS